MIAKASITLIAGLAVVTVAGAAAAQAPAPAPIIANPTYAVIPLEIMVDRPAAVTWAKVGPYCAIGEWLRIPAGCKMLHAAFEKDPNLTPFVAIPPGGKNAWAHFNEYIWEDTTQQWRFKEFKTERGPFPIITIQPPRNKVFGDPRIIVDRIEAKDWRDTASLKKRITTSVEKYCKKLKEGGYIPPAHALEKHGFTSPSGLKLLNISEESYGHGQKPADESKEPITGPWGPDPPAPQPFNPNYPQFPPNGPAQQPVFPADNNVGGLFDNLLSPESGTFFLLIIAGLRLFEMFGPMFGFDTGLIKKLRELAEKAKPTIPPASAFEPVVQAPPITVVQPQPAGVAPGFLMLSNGQIVAAPK